MSLERLEEFFPAGATESERHILRHAFVYTEEYADLVTPPPTAPRLMVGRKGTGKTAVIDFYESVLRDAKLPVLVLRPMDLELGGFADRTSLGEASRLALALLTRFIAVRLGQQMRGRLAGDAKVLHDEAVQTGAKDLDVIERTAQLLPRVASALPGALDLSRVLPGIPTATVRRLQKAIESNVAKSHRTFHLFLDDTDQVAAPDDPHQLQRVWAFLIAARDLTQRVPQLRCVVTLREEVWRRLLRDKAAQRDQADHFSRLVRELFPTRAHIAAVVRRRVELAAEASGRPGELYAAFFEGEGARMPTSDEFSGWEDLIVIRSRERPRDAIQLVNQLARGTRHQGRDLITEADFDREIRAFSTERVQYLAQELEAECPVIVEVVQALAEIDFNQGAFKADFETTRTAMHRIMTQFGVTLRGRKLRPESDEDALELLGFLFELGIMNARVSDRREPHGFRHIMPRDDSRLVSKARWNDLQSIVWEVNPAYRDHLIQLREDLTARTGLPPRRRKDRRK